MDAPGERRVQNAGSLCSVWSHRTARIWVNEQFLQKNKMTAATFWGLSNERHRITSAECRKCCPFWGRSRKTAFTWVSSFQKEQSRNSSNKPLLFFRLLCSSTAAMNTVGAAPAFTTQQFWPHTAKWWSFSWTTGSAFSVPHRISLFCLLIGTRLKQIN